MAERLDGNKVMYKILSGTAALMTECNNRVYGPPLGIPSVPIKSSGLVPGGFQVLPPSSER